MIIQKAERRRREGYNNPKKDDWARRRRFAFEISASEIAVNKIRAGIFKVKSPATKFKPAKLENHGKFEKFIIWLKNTCQELKSVLNFIKR